MVTVALDRGCRRRAVQGSERRGGEGGGGVAKKVRSGVSENVVRGEHHTEMSSRSTECTAGRSVFVM